ncbi:hypothetical protein HPB50_019633 [Hyalomma asiaticum]|uniref:Uncharacterized protein n=1 Tax=Hyalomma asiaticum TaxID=266040 RepID=A0ACB7TQ87_HYAAI|nr:hypothetical protein HPB50_019633 [Hyalomma asiaticum]
MPHTEEKKREVLKEKAKKKASGAKPHGHSGPTAETGKTGNIPICSKNSKDNAHRQEGGRQNFCPFATSWPALPSKAFKPVTTTVTIPKTSEPPSAKAPSTAENIINKAPTTVSVNDDAQLINILKMLINVIRSLIAGRQTPAALAARQLLEPLVPVLHGIHYRNSMNARGKPCPFVLQWNVRFLRPRHADLALRLVAMDSPTDVIALQETYERKDKDFQAS